MDSNTIRIKRHVLDDIRATVGSLPAESGGWLSMDADGTIDGFAFDTGATWSAAQVRPHLGGFSRLARGWYAANRSLAGWLHSHPAGLTALSAADRDLIARFFAMNEDVDSFIAPIVQTIPDTGEFKIYFYRVHRAQPQVPISVQIEVIDDNKANAEILSALSHRRETFERVGDDLNLPLLNSSVVLAIGCGSAAGAYAAAAQCGVSNFLLIDGDRVEARNISVQGFRTRDIGRFKVDVLGEMIRDLNPDARVRVVRDHLTDRISDELIARWLQSPIATISEAVAVNGFELTVDHAIRPAATIICGTTDSFPAQARAARLALRLQVPYVASQRYDGALAGEIVIGVPGRSAACPRCILHSRYNAYASNTIPERPSRGAPSPSTAVQNGLLTRVMLEILHERRPSRRYGRQVDGLAQNNFIQVVTDGAAEDFDWMEAEPFSLRFAKTAFFSLPPVTNCPDCGGNGFTAEGSRRISDSRDLKLVPARQVA